MTDFTFQFGSLALKVTLFCGLILLITRWVTRPVSGLVLAGSMFGLLWMPVLVFVSFPQMFHLRIESAWFPIPTERTLPLPEPRSLTMQPEEVAEGIPLQELERFMVMPVQVRPQPTWMDLVGPALLAFYLLGFAVALIRFLHGWFSVRHLLRASHKIHDGSLQTEVQNLARRIGIDQTIDIYQCEEPGLAATLGYRQPLILLPPEWRSWIAAERQAVLAHELAHIAHQDYGLGLLARLVGMVHFYHPLVHLVLRRFRWHQEVQADALAAALTGGQRVYRRSLIQLALRLPHVGSNAGCILPTMTGGFLLRRIEMLQVTEDIRVLSRKTRWLVCSFLMIGVLLISTLTGSTAPKTSDFNEEKPAPYVLKYLHPNQKGFVAMRPAELFSQPGMQEVCDSYRTALEKVLKEMKITLPEEARFENIEQFICNIQLDTKGTGEKGSRSLSVGAGSLYIRMKKDFDWLQFVKSLPVQLTEKKIADTKYWNVYLPLLPFPVKQAMILPDSRSVALIAYSDEEDLAQRFAEQAKGETIPVGNCWKQLDACAFTMLCDNTDGNYTKRFTKDLEQEPEGKNLLEQITWFGYGIELGEKKPCRMIIETTEQADQKQIEKTVTSLLNKLRKETEEEINKEETPEPSQQFLLDLVKSAKLHIDGRQMQWTAYSSLRIKDLIQPMPMKD